MWNSNVIFSKLSHKSMSIKICMCLCVRAGFSSIVPHTKRCWKFTVSKAFKVQLGFTFLFSFSVSIAVLSETWPVTVELEVMLEMTSVWWDGCIHLHWAKGRQLETLRELLSLEPNQHRIGIQHVQTTLTSSSLGECLRRWSCCHEILPSRSVLSTSLRCRQFIGRPPRFWRP